MILVIDNYDSFTYNLVQYVGEIEEKIEVYRNDKITTEEITNLRPTHIIISPGPGRPENAGISVELIKKFYKTTPILGVCLGHQAIGQAFGGEIIHAPEIVHGKRSLVYHNKNPLFNKVPTPFKAVRYHSLMISSKSLLSDEFIITAWTTEKLIMGIQHRKHKLFGVQFHPESFLTEEGKRIVSNFLKIW
ncbi:anthranilate synthase component II [Spirochaetota bacterium]